MTFFEPDNLRAITGGRWLKRLDLPIVLDGVGIDSRADLNGKIFIAICGETHDGHSFIKQAAGAGAGLLIVERDVDCKSLPDGVGVLHVDDTRKALGRLAMSYRRTLKGAKIVAVTGSAGKTTTKRLIHAVLSTTHQGTAAPKSFNNDIGVPLTILAARGVDKYVVVEIGTNAPGEVVQLATIAEPDLAVITTVGRSHLEGFGSVAAVAKEKCSLLPHLRRGGSAIINADAPYIRDHLKPVRSVVLFGESENADLRMTARGASNDGWFFEVNGRHRFALGLPGKHNAMNALAAVAVGRRFSVDDDRISEALASVVPDAMRMTEELVGDVGGVGGITVYNDAYNANPDSVTAALETFIELAADAPRRIVILGDMLELGPAAADLHREISDRLIDIDRRARIDHLIAVGRLACHMTEAPLAAWGRKRITVLKKLTGASARRIAGLLEPGDAVLLKGSRGMELERLIDMLGQLAPSAAVAS
ncbi:MAG: UDP-N-acetylmuramoyl-tripeptide--D-alanyl-D-alanine ligase [Phycisphaerales bacterium]|nr:MAG: UDP-N-acetylmuramoyl-tripeptide--D-alanyl-D-alanine ligase [Phycisphaerales bacterium]